MHEPRARQLQSASVNPAEFEYELPEELIAQRPLAARSASRLLAMLEDGSLHDLRFTDIAALLRPGDLLVVNDSKVVPARLFGRKRSGGRVEMLLERVLDDALVLAQLRASHAPVPGSWIDFEGEAEAQVVARRGQFYLLLFRQPVLSLLEAAGHVPLPPYIRRGDEATDRARYQTVFASQPGSVAAPTAGLHFDEPLVAELRRRGVDFTSVTLHVGAGTFAPLREAQFASGRLHSERFRIGAEAAAAIGQTQRRGGRIVAVGTTAARVLETAAAGGPIAPCEGETELFIRPGHAFRAVDVLVTNFHLPRSSLLMLVCAFGGTQRILDAYRHAVAQRYRFFSYGDAMFVTRSAGGGPPAQ